MSVQIAPGANLFFLVKQFRPYPLYILHNLDGSINIRRSIMNQGVLLYDHYYHFLAIYSIAAR